MEENSIKYEFDKSFNIYGDIKKQYIKITHNDIMTYSEFLYYFVITFFKMSFIYLVTFIYINALFNIFTYYYFLIIFFKFKNILFFILLYLLFLQYSIKKLIFKYNFIIHYYIRNV